jgi:hypothetical protein
LSPPFSAAPKEVSCGGNYSAMKPTVKPWVVLACAV